MMSLLFGVAIHTHTETLEQVVKRADVIAIVTRTANKFVANEVLYGAPLPKTPFSIGDSYEGAKHVVPPRPDPDGKLEAPLVWRYASTLTREQFAAAKQLVVFLHVSRSATGPEFTFTVDDAYESLSELPKIRAALINRKPSPPAP